MIRVLAAFLILFASVCLGIQLQADPGYLLIKINHWIIETNVWIAIISLFFIFVLIHALLQLSNKLARTPRSIRKWNARRLAYKAQATTRQGLIEYSEGYWKKAKNHLIQALPNTDTPLLNYLTAARAAQKMGDSQLRDHYLREAQQSMPEAKIAVELTQAELQLANHQWEQALATLRHLQDLAPHHPYVLKLLMKLYEQVRDWALLIDLLPDLKRYKVISDVSFKNLEHKAYLNALIDLEKQNQAEAVATLFQKVPRSLAYDPEIVAAYVQFLLNNKENVEAETILKGCLRKELHPKLIELYSHLDSKENQLAFAESLLKKNPHSASLFLCLGRLCIAQHLWGKAKYYLEQSIELNETPNTYMELGRLHEQLHDAYLAGENYKKGLELATKA